MMKVMTGGSGTLTTNPALIARIYRALITQSGTNAPTAVVLENTFGATLTFSYNVVGQYRVNLAGAFTVNQTAITLDQSLMNVSIGKYAGASPGDIDSCDIYVVDMTDHLFYDGFLVDNVLQIIVYP